MAKYAFESGIAALGPVGWWTFSDPAGATTVADASGNGYIGTPGTNFTFGNPGLWTGSTAAVSSGATNSPTAGIVISGTAAQAGLALMGDFTLVALINPSSLPTTQVIYAKDNGSGAGRWGEFYLTNIGQVRFDQGATNVYASVGRVTAGSWWLLGITYNSSANLVSCYINGVLDGTHAGATHYDNTTIPAIIGCRDVASSPLPFFGTISDIAIAPICASAPQMASLWKAASQIPTVTTTQSGGYKGYIQTSLSQFPSFIYPLNDPSTAVIQDAGYNGEYGSLVSGSNTQAGFSSPWIGMQGMQFNGTGGIICNTEQAYTTWTAWGWYRTTGVSQALMQSNANNTLSGGFNFTVYLDENGCLTHRSFNGVTIADTDSAPTNDGQWHFFYAMMDSTNLYLMRDGVLVGTAADNATAAESQYILIGDGQSGGSTTVSPLTGGMAGVAFASNSLSLAFGSQLFAVAQPTISAPGTQPSLPAAVLPATGDVWTYKFYQMQNGQPGYTSEKFLFSIPINQVQFGSRLNNVGQFQGTVYTSDVRIQDVMSGLASWNMLCERTALYVDLNGVLVWGGILQQAKYQRTYHYVQLIAQDWWGYFANSRLISWNSSYTNVDQLAVAADLINVAQGAASSLNSPAIPAGYCVGGNVGIALGATAAGALSGSVTSGVEVSAVYPQSAFKQVGQAISDIGTAANGFDWTIDVAYNGSGVPTKTFNIWYPRAGTSQAAGSKVTFNMAGTSGVDYIWTTGQTQAANVSFAAGSGSGNTAIAAEASNSALWTAGWPLMEDSISFTDVTDQTLLDQMALAYLNQVEYPVSQPELYYACGHDSDQPLGSYKIGDDCRIIIDPDDMFPEGYDSSGSNTTIGEQWWRIVQWTVYVEDDGKSYNDIVTSTPVIL